MPSKTTLRSSAKERLEDARVLFERARYDGAAYLCGYAVEFALKARICDTLDTDDYPENLPGFKIHKLATLLFLSGREKYITQNTASAFSWSIVTAIWQPEMRYQEIGTISRDKAQTMIEATNDLLLLL